MPALVFLGQRWGISSDDFVFPSVVELLVHLSWLGALVASYIVNRSNLRCDTGDEMKYFYFGTLTLDSAYFIITLAILCISMQGSIKNTRPRRHMWLFLLVKLLVYIAEIVWICLSTYWIFGYTLPCNYRTIWIVRGAVLWSWFIRFLKLVWTIVVLSPWISYVPRIDGPRSLGKAASKVAGYGHQTYDLWEKRSKRLFCCVSDNRDSHEAFKDVGSITAEYFDLDLVPSDVLAGLILVLKQQMDEEASLQEVRILNPMRDRSVRSGANQSLDLATPKEWMTISNMAYYMRYAIACYGSFIYIADNPCSGPCWICCRSRCCSQKSPHIVNVFHDDRCQSNTEAVKNWTNLTDDDFIYISFRVEYKETPFFVAVDRSKNTVVVALRGTWSVQDGLTDFSGRGAKMAVPGVDDAYCHTAVLERANSVLDKLNNMEILETAFSKLNADAKLVITGHSLGSGIASVLSILLRPKYPLLMCYAFSPMGCCLSPNLSKYTEEFICSPTLGADMIARTNMFTLTELKVNLLRALIQIDIPKYQILARGFLRFLCCCCLLRSSSETDQLLLSARLGPLYSDEDELNVQVCGLEESLQSAEADLETVRRMHWPFKLPGQLLHIVETNDSPGCCNCPPAYQAYWTGTSTFDKIIMSSSMLSDHLPDNILHALDQMHDLQVEPM